jgi:hypothetical protein
VTVNTSNDDRKDRKGGQAPQTEDRGDRGASHSPSGWPDMQGEGNKDAAREYNESQRDFVESGKVERAARESEPQSDAERREMEKAEREGRSHARK